ncbi:hypothetical protein [Bacillus sp. V2I10]|nr:hypothetical protein [Bacillus sp. V2I10]MDQ0861818.1 hypothetical protein [Bacillus sp. V2I10]
MGCCSPNYRQTVNEEEEKLNRKGKDCAPLLLKIAGSLVIAGGTLVVILT